jgi:hypothetical protein
MEAVVETMVTMEMTDLMKIQMMTRKLVQENQKDDDTRLAQEKDPN